MLFREEARFESQLQKKGFIRNRSEYCFVEAVIKSEIPTIRTYNLHRQPEALGHLQAAALPATIRLI